MSLEPVSFRKPRESAPRLSKPYVPGKHDARFWTAEEKAVLERYYPEGGAAACMAHLPPHRTMSSVYGQAKKQGLEAKVGGGPKHRIIPPEGLDDEMRAAWPLMSGDKKGEVNAFADTRGLPRWWITKRAMALGLTQPHKKEPPWTAAEDALLGRLDLTDLDKASATFREHGFARSPTAINVRAKRKGIARRSTRATFSATEAAKILGIDSKGVTAEILRGDLVATKRQDKRLPQQGGSSWDITPADLRDYIVTFLERVDFRKVDKFEVVALLTGDHKRERIGNDT